MTLPNGPCPTARACGPACCGAKPSERPFHRRLAVSVGLTLYSFACQWLLAPWGGYLAVFFCTLAVVLSALYGGLKRVY